MGKIYVNQPFKIKTVVMEDIDGVDTIVDISGLPVAFNFVKPDGTEASVTGAITDGPNGEVEYDVAEDFFPDAGKYNFYTVVTFGNGDVPSEPCELIIYETGL